MSMTSAAKENGAFSVKNYKKILWGILLLGFLVRAAGLGYGLPSLYHQDEPIIVNHALAVGSGGWNMHFFIIPPFTIYFLFLLYGLLFLFGNLFGLYPTPDAFGAAFLRDPTVFYLIGRFFLGVLAGTATVALVARTAREFLGRAAALWSAFFLALCFFHAQQSHYIYADIPLTLALSLCLFRGLRLTEDPSRENFLWLGIIFGWAVSVKYTALYLTPLFPILALTVLKKSLSLSKRLAGLSLFGISAFLSFAAIAPFTFLDWSNFYGQMLRQVAAEETPGAWHHLRYSLWEGMGGLLCLSALGGAFLMARRRARVFGLLLGFIVFYFGVNAVFSQPYARYMLPMAPWLCLLAGYAWAESLWPVLSRSLLSRTLVLGAVGLGVGGAIFYSNYLFLKPDTRTLCREWIESHVPAGSTVVRDHRFFGPALAMSPEQVREKYAQVPAGAEAPNKRKRLELLLKEQSGKTTYRLFTLIEKGGQKETPFLFMGPFVEADPAALDEAGANYLIFNYTDADTALHRFRTRHADRLLKKAAFNPYRGELRQGSLDPHDSTAAPHHSRELFRRNRLGPPLEVYQWVDKKSGR